MGGPASGGGWRRAEEVEPVILEDEVEAMPDAISGPGPSGELGLGGDLG